TTRTWWPAHVSSRTLNLAIPNNSWRGSSISSLVALRRCSKSEGATDRRGEAQDGQLGTTTRPSRSAGAHWQLAGRRRTASPTNPPLRSPKAWRRALRSLSKLARANSVRDDTLRQTPTRSSSAFACPTGSALADNYGWLPAHPDHPPRR